MELKFEERVTELEGLLESREKDLAVLLGEKESLMKEALEWSKTKVRLEIKLNSLARERADLILVLSQGQATLAEEEDHLQSAQSLLKVEGELAYKQHCSALEVSRLIEEEGDRTSGGRASLFSGFLPMQERAKQKQQSLDETRKRVATAEQDREARKIEMVNTRRALERSRVTLDGMKALYDKERAEMNAIRKQFQNLGNAMRQQTTRACSELESLRHEVSKLKQIEAEQDDRFRKASIYRRSLQSQLQ
ncbi:hypothetical protein HOP50_10g59120 [Chloropicon primus]|uniref:Coiled-coil domain-containing protein n=1 Tax=Chloropicon primus TaxID=1764295 RepID=A0A5B8MUE4_9CHLO|nr:hypothetical protein A3770_10p58920 [Chloropicon primus]UPR02586.1 hypothetical protein HOP50_10g59120 [Chloropicon primus]|eukprot:QDZ23374.1 hypothetical protein A3770_10p58920 [Chloropicon primus]